MPRRDLLSAAQRAQVMALPTSLGEYEDLYTLTPADQEFVGVHRTSANRLGVAVQLCFLRHPAERGRRRKRCRRRCSSSSRSRLALNR